MTTSSTLNIPLPHDPDAEAAVIGSLLIDGEAMGQVRSILSADDFYRARYRMCYAACQTLYDNRKDIDPITLSDALTSAGLLEEAGGQAYLAELLDSTPTSVNVVQYARIVAERSARRKIILSGQQIIELGFDDGTESEDAIRDSVDRLFKIQTSRNTGGFVPLSSLLDSHLQTDFMDDEMSGGGGLETGFSDLDSILGGLQSSDLVILGARPALGKSSLALNAGVHAAKQGAITGIFSLEMSAEQVALRILAAETEIPMHNLRTGLYPESMEEVLVDTVGRLSGLPIFIDETRFQTTADMRGKAQQLQLEHGLDFLIVDYLQLVEGLARRRGGGENRVQEITEISRSLKGIAGDLTVPVFACSQLSRGVENRPGHRPQLSDLRDSGSIEQDADVVMFLHREDKQYTEEQWNAHAPGRTYPRNIAEVIVAKHRHGPTGSVHLYFREAVMRFELLARGDGI